MRRVEAMEHWPLDHAAVQSRAERRVDSVS
jgi:hypothetical protein